MEDSKQVNKKVMDIAAPKASSKPAVTLPERKLMRPEDDTPKTEDNKVTNDTDSIVVRRVGVKIAPLSSNQNEDTEKPSKDEKAKDEGKDETSEQEDTATTSGVPPVDDSIVEPSPATTEAPKPDEVPEKSEPESQNTSGEGVIKELKEPKKDSEVKEEQEKDQTENDKALDEIPSKEDSNAEGKEKQETVQPEATSGNNFVAMDAVPESESKLASETKEKMQEPKIYDTKEYYVPIGRHHTSGNSKFWMLIIIIIVVGLGAYYYFYKDNLLFLLDIIK